MEKEKTTYFEEIQQLASKYVEDRLLLIKLQAAEKAARLSSSIIKAVILAVISFFILLIISFLAGYYLSVATGSYLYGFGILACIYLALFFLVIYTHKKYFNKYITDKVIETIFSRED